MTTFLSGPLRCSFHTKRSFEGRQVHHQIFLDFLVFTNLTINNTYITMHYLQTKKTIIYDKEIKSIWRERFTRTTHFSLFLGPTSNTSLHAFLFHLFKYYLKNFLPIFFQFIVCSPASLRFFRFWLFRNVFGAIGCWRVRSIPVLGF